MTRSLTCTKPTRATRWIPVAAGALLAGWLSAVPARAQTLPPLPPEYRWTFEVHGGGTFGSSSSGGTAALPPPGATFTPLAGGPPSREVPSWAFGDGAALFNEVARNLGVSQQIVPLDPLLTSRIMRQRPGAAFGGRLTRWVNPRIDLEFSVDFSFRHGELASVVAPSLEATRASYEAAFNAFFATAPGLFANPSTVVTTTFQDRAGFEAIGTGTVNIRLGHGTWQPYAAVGGGVIVGLGTFPSFTLKGDYQFEVNGFPVHQTDTVTVHQRMPPRPLLVLGGGLTRDLTPRLGLRADVRVYVAAGAPETSLESTGTSISNGRVGVVYPYPAPLALSLSSVSLAQSSLRSGVSATTFKGQGARVISTIAFGFFVKM
jgi:hypothetical protein